MSLRTRLEGRLPRRAGANGCSRLKRHSESLLMSPSPHVIEAEGGGQIGVVRHAEPIRHRLAVENEIQRLVPMGVLDRMNESSVDIPSQFVGGPLESKDMEIFGETRRCLPKTPYLPMPFFLRGSEHMHRHVIAMVVGSGLDAEFKYIDFGRPSGVLLMILLLKPEGAGTTGVHGPSLNLVITVAGASLGVQRGGTIIVITLAAQVRGHCFPAHAQVQLTVMNCDIGGIKPGRRTPLPPGHADRPLVRVEHRAVKLIPHRFKPYPMAAIFLVRERQVLAMPLGYVLQGPLPGPAADRMFIESIARVCIRSAHLRHRSCRRILHGLRIRSPGKINEKRPQCGR